MLRPFAHQHLAVIDGDMQHDESILPQMLQKLENEHLDLVVGTLQYER
jgi:dolichol-phosphate mannosyltransferase